MAIKYLFLMMTVFPNCLLAQQSSPFDKMGDEVTKIECGGIIFTKVERLPGFRISKEAFQDSLSMYLRSGNASVPEKKYTFLFVLTSRNQLFELTSLQGSQGGEPLLYQAILDNAHLFTPAKQNGNSVCMYAKLELDFRDKKISARFFQ